MNQSNLPTGHISRASVLLVMAVIIALGMIAAGAYMDSQRSRWAYEASITATPHVYPCSPLVDGSWLPARVQKDFEEKCKPK